MSQENKCLYSTDLVNECSKAIVEGLDLLLLLGPDPMDGGVDLHVHGGQQALVHGHSGDGGHHLVGHATSHTSTEAHIPKLYSPSSLSRHPSSIPTDHFEPPTAHSSTTAAHSSIGAADSVALLATAHTMSTVAREGAAAEALGWTPGGRSGVGGGLQGSDRHGHRGCCERRDSAEGRRVRQTGPSLAHGAIYLSRGGTLLRCDWLQSSAGE